MSSLYLAATILRRGPSTKFIHHPQSLPCDAGRSGHPEQLKRKLLGNGRKVGKGGACREDRKSSFGSVDTLTGKGR